MIPVPHTGASIQLFECVCQYCRKQEADKGEGEHTTLFHYIRDWECCRGLSVVLYSGQHAIMKLTYHGDELSWLAVLRHDSSLTLSTN